MPSPSYPFPTYPNSWYGLAWSRDLKAGRALPVRAFGRDLVVFRGVDGQARVLDAICPHLGAHLGVQSRVEGNTIVCPFHGWRFDGTGACVDIPYAPKIPAKARVNCWPVAEVNGAIFAWYHEQKAAPTFEIPALPMGRWGPPLRGAWNRPIFASVDVRSHVQEMNENLFDFRHFVTIHHFQHGAEPLVEMDGPFAHATLVGRGAFGRVGFPLDTRSSMYGAGFTVIHVRVPVEFAVLVLKTPVDEETVRHSFAVTSPRRVPGLDRVLLRALQGQVARDVRADSTIWQHKRHLAKPLVVGGDGPILAFRRWHQQFYTPIGALRAASK